MGKGYVIKFELLSVVVSGGKFVKVEEDVTEGKTPLSLVGIATDDTVDDSVTAVDTVTTGALVEPLKDSADGGIRFAVLKDVDNAPEMNVDGILLELKALVGGDPELIFTSMFKLLSPFEGSDEPEIDS